MDIPGDILQEKHYYPFGMNMNYGWMNAAALDNKYQYNGKELNDDFGLNWNDYGARWYEASVGRFLSIDRFAEKYFLLTPYQYGANNPIKYVDINGDSLKMRAYDDGKYQNLHWDYSESSGYGFYTEKGNLYSGNDKFFGQVYDAVARLFLGNEGKSLITDIATSTEFNVELAQAGRNITADKDVGLAPTLEVKTPTREGIKKAPFFITLGHEMAHAFANAKGSAFDSWVTIPTVSGDVSLSKSEIYASHVENLFRAENGLPLRTHYSPTDTGGVIEETRLIDSKGASLYFSTGTRDHKKMSNSKLPEEGRYRYNN